MRHGGTALAHVNYAVAVRSAQPEVAEEHLVRALALEPTHVYAQLNLGLLRIEDGRVDDGIALLDAAAAGRPDWAIVHHWRSIGLENSGRLDEALETQRRAVAIEPAHHEYAQRFEGLLYKAARARQIAGEVAASLPLLHELHQRRDSWADSRFLSGFAHQHAGAHAAAVGEYEAALVTHPEHAQTHFNLAFARMELGLHEQALIGFARSVELDSKLYSAHAHRARSLRALGRVDEAERELALYRARQAEQ